MIFIIVRNRSEFYLFEMNEEEFLYRYKNVKRFRLVRDEETIDMVLGDEIYASTISKTNAFLLRKKDVEDNKKIPYAIYVKMEECGGFCSWCVGPKCKYFGIIELDKEGYVKVLFKVWEKES